MGVVGVVSTNADTSQGVYGSVPVKGISALGEPWAKVLPHCYES